MKISRQKTIYIALLTVIAILTVSFILSIIFPRKTQDEKSYYDMKCEAFAVANTNLSDGQIIFLGDSITDLCPLDSYYSSLPLASYNRGIGGDTTEGVLARLDISCKELSPSVVVLMIGTNDINGGRSTEAIKDSYSRILSSLHSDLADTKVICVSVIPMNKDIEKYSNLDATKNTEKVKELNAEIGNLAERYNASYLNIFDSLTDDSGLLDTRYSDDGLHLNDRGFEVWAKLLLPLLEN